ncbi:MAG TPA: hypothetical protein V6D17_10980 [Candidatus Obscuribacterales bacterium]
MKRLQATILTLSLMAGLGLTGCSAPEGPTEHYVSSQVTGESQKINLDEVKKAFWESRGKDFNEWMSAFEKRVNEIYEGSEIVSIDATRKTGHLNITGYIEDKKEPGYQAGEEKLFTIEQTGDVTDNQLPYKLTGHDGRPYYEGQHSILGSPIVQMLVLSHLMSSWGGRYHTPYDRVVVLKDQRSTFRSSPDYMSQKAANQDFMSRFKKKSTGDGFASRNRFGGGLSSETSAQRRSWDGIRTGSPGVSSRSYGWGGRRSPFGMSRGWGGRRR